jgi:putative endonuclease
MKTRFFYVYILFSQKDDGLYIGYTNDLKNRLGEHFKGRVTATKYRRPLMLIHYEAFTNINDAKSREEFLKSGFGRSQLKRALKNKLREFGYKY